MHMTDMQHGYAAGPPFGCRPDLLWYSASWRRRGTRGAGKQLGAISQPRSALAFCHPVGVFFKHQPAREQGMKRPRVSTTQERTEGQGARRGDEDGNSVRQPGTGPWLHSSCRVHARPAGMRACRMRRARLGTRHARDHPSKGPLSKSTLKREPTVRPRHPPRPQTGPAPRAACSAQYTAATGGRVGG